MGMPTIRSIVSVAAMVALISFASDGFAASVALGGKHRVKADTLTGFQETPTVSSSGTGSFTADIDERTQTITYALTYHGLTAAATVAHIHFGDRFIAGGISAFLCGGSKPACPAGTADEAVVTGVISVTDIIGPAVQGIAPGEFDELIRAILAGVTYANVHTSNFPNGEIRGQINDNDQRQP